MFIFISSPIVVGIDGKLSINFELNFKALSFNKVFFGSYFKQKSKFDLVYSSPLNRAHETAKILIDNQNIILDDRLKERCYGDWSAKNKEQIKLSEGEDSYYAARRGWVTSPPNGESLKDVSLRVKSFIDELPDSGNILIVSHGNTIRAISVLFGINTESNVNSFEIKVGTILKV